MIWDELTTDEIARLDRQIPVILPIAATEQHGPHLPLATDRLICENFIQMLDSRMMDHILCLPTVSVGCSEHHMDFAGSLSLTHATFLAVVSEILASVEAHGFAKLVIFNAHGGNIGVGQVITEFFGRRHPEIELVFLTWWRIASNALFEITETGPGGVGHACEFETSLMLHFAPQMVRHDLIQPGGNQPTYAWAEGDMLRGSRGALYRSMKQMSPNGVFGDPTRASAEKGVRIASAVLDELERMIHSLRL
jgi:creatinine amidohydrolase